MNKRMNGPWRWMDTGVLPPERNMALSRALLAARGAGEAPSTLRFLRFVPSALVGRHGDPEKELDLAYCRRRGVAVQRRITGGGAIYMDEGVLGWELFLGRDEAGSAEMGAISKRVCTAVARAVSRFGVAAEYRAPTEICVAGRKLCGTGGALEDAALVYQGSLLLDFDAAEMMRVLPAARAAQGAAGAGLTSLRELLGAPPPPDAVHAALRDALGGEFDVRFAEGALNAAEERRSAAALAEFAAPEWIGVSLSPATNHQ